MPAVSYDLATQPRSTALVRASLTFMHGFVKEPQLFILEIMY